MMAKNTAFTNPAFTQKKNSTSNFNLVHKSTNFNSIFDVQPLDAAEVNLIENLLITGSNPNEFTETQVKEDIDFLKELTAEIKAIGRQGILLMGERVAKARERLKCYHNGTFTKWLNATFGSRRTGYNVLTYYDFYLALPDSDLKEKFRKLPQRTAYILASRQGDMKQKEEIVRGYDEQKCLDLISIIQEKLPIQEADKRKQKDFSLSKVMQFKEILNGFVQKGSLTPNEKVLFSELREIIDSILSSNSHNLKNTKNKKEVF